MYIMLNIERRGYVTSPLPSTQAKAGRQKLGPENGWNATRFGFEAAFRHLDLFRVALGLGLEPPSCRDL